MTAIECFLCLEIKKELENCIKIGSSQWNTQHIQSVIEKHMWPMTSLKSKSSWLCCTCWEILHDFHDFYKRIKDSHDYYECLVKSEHDMEIDEYEVNDILPDVMSRSSDVVADEADMSSDDNNMDDEIKEHIIKNKPEVASPETVILNDTLAGNSTLPSNKENDEEKQDENPLELSTIIDGDATTQKLRKQFLAKYYRFTCIICNDPCASFAMLQEHFREVHHQEAYMMCCGKKYTNRNSFGEHVKTHLDPDCFKCKICCKILKNKRNLVHHIARWHEGTIFRCSICNKKFVEKSKYNEHKSEHKDVLLDNDNAGECNEDSEDDYFAEANRSDSSNTIMMKSCETATNDNDALQTPQQDQLEEHCTESLSYESEDSHEGKQKTINQLSIQGYLSKTSKFKCDLCQEPCESFGELRQHFAQDHEDQKPYVICCGEKFRSRNCLSEHVKFHLNPDCFKCPYCEKVLKNKRNFLAHIKRWHEENTFSCDICEKRFVYKTEYEEHKSSNHLSNKKTRLVFESNDDDFNTNSSVTKSENEGVSGSYVNLDTTQMEQVFEENESATTVLHQTNEAYDNNVEISLEITKYEGDNILEESVKVKTKTSKGFVTGNEKCPSNNKTSPHELMQFDKFLSKHHKFTCHICDNPNETYENFLKLRQHFAAVHKVEGYVLCCGAKFVRRRGLVDHIKGHLDPNYFKCTYCSRVLRDRRGLLNHIALHEGNVKRCDVCNKKFYDPIKFENHKLTHVENDGADDTPKADCDDSDDDMPLIYSIGLRKTKQDILVDADKETKQDVAAVTTTSAKPAPDYTKNLQRQVENDEFLAKHFKMVCAICEDASKTFETFALLREHFTIEHEEDPYLICCAQRFKKRDTLVQHIKMHLNPNDFTCTYCSKVLKSKRNLMYHIAACHEGKQFRCEICQKKFVEESSYEYHKKTHKPDDNPHFPCPECGRSYKIKHKLTHHINTTHRHRYARLCDICGTYFRDINLYSAHMKSKHVESSAKESYPCDICGRILGAKSSLRLHKRTQHPDKDSFPYNCHICSKPVATKGLLNYHIRMSHKKIKPHKCTVCGKAYKELKQLKGHMGIHTGEALYTCNFCPKMFNSTGNRSTHRKKCHPQEWEEWKKTFYIETNTTTHDSLENH